MYIIDCRTEAIEIRSVLLLYLEGEKMSNKILAINAGSSSLKFQLLEMPSEAVIAKGIFDRIGFKDGKVKYQTKRNQFQKNVCIPSHEFAVQVLLGTLVESGEIHSIEEIVGVGHRVAHGGESFKGSVLVDEKNEEIISDLGDLAPSHNPISLSVIKSFKIHFPSIKNVAVFDTSFHQTMEPVHYLYPLPYSLYEKFHVRKYGFHGISHAYIAETVEKIFQQEEHAKENVKIISCHLGNGASICAIKNKQSINTSMGFTPLDGLMMGSRCGSIDPMIIPYLVERQKMPIHEVKKLLNEASGLLGISEMSNDMRDLIQAATEGNQKATLAIEMFVNRVAHTIASYIVDLGGVHAIVFTGGIGENAAIIRSDIIDKLQVFGITANKDLNENSSLFIQSDHSNCKILIVKTNEELMIAREVYRLISQL